MLVTFGICFKQHFAVLQSLTSQAWIFFQNIGFNMVSSDPFMSHLATQFGYSAKEFQAL